MAIALKLETELIECNHFKQFLTCFRSFSRICILSRAAVDKSLSCYSDKKICYMLPVVEPNATIEFISSFSLPCKVKKKHEICCH